MKGKKGGQSPELDSALKMLNNTTQNLEASANQAGGSSDYLMVNNSSGPSNSFYCPGKTWFTGPEQQAIFNKSIPYDGHEGWRRGVDGNVGAEPFSTMSSEPAPISGGKKKRKGKKKSKKSKKTTKKSTKKPKKKGVVKKMGNSVKRVGKKVKNSAKKTTRKIKKFFSKLV